jgi:hypothetical protein
VQETPDFFYSRLCPPFTAERQPAEIRRSERRTAGASPYGATQLKSLKPPLKSKKQFFIK